MLDIFDEVIVITLSSTDTSFALASDELPFDQSSLTEMLRYNGESEFIIFDTSAVRAIAEAGGS